MDGFTKQDIIDLNTAGLNIINEIKNDLKEIDMDSQKAESLQKQLDEEREGFEHIKSKITELNNLVNSNK